MHTLVTQSLRSTSFVYDFGSVHFLMFQVFNPLAHIHLPVFHSVHLLQKTQTRKENKYDQWVSEVELDLLSFQYLHGGMDPTTKVVYKKLASVIVTKHKQPYTVCIAMLQAQFFLLLSIVCIRASHFSVNHPANSTLMQFPGDQPVPCNSRGGSFLNSFTFEYINF